MTGDRTMPPGPRAARRRAVPLAGADWVRPVPAAQPLPLQVVPADTQVGLAAWARENRTLVRSWLDRHGAVLFRGFPGACGDFADVVAALAGAPEPYRERSSPRQEVGRGIYTTTEHPADQPIPLHCENSYQRRFPATLVFGCVTPPTEGGATPLADTRRILARIDAPVVRAFATRGVRYVRNYGAGVGLPWQQVFTTTDPAEVDAYCAAHGIEARWRAGGLRTIQTRPALAVHPRTGERVWFNHAAFFHVSTLLPAVRAALTAQFAEEELPSNSYYGDGGAIEPEVLEQVRAAYAAEEVCVPWRSGDVLVVDNLLTAHGRQPFRGPRRVLVGMAAPLSWDDVAAPEGHR